MRTNRLLPQDYLNLFLENRLQNLPIEVATFLPTEIHAVKLRHEKYVRMGYGSLQRNFRVSLSSFTLNPEQNKYFRFEIKAMETKHRESVEKEEDSFLVIMPYEVKKVLF